MDGALLYGRGLGFPPRVGSDGRVAWSSGEQSIEESIRIIVLTEPNERLMLPEFGAGLKRFLFEPNTVETRRLIEEEIVRALRRWEPRLSVDAVRVEADPGDAQSAVATVSYTLVATQTAQQVSLRLRLEG
ncbi:MAG: GPW/gp25 family protein [Polyangiaceae bacterium]|nr:GPW/gp25 family protein [Polyangiaceae bacterium]